MPPLINIQGRTFGRWTVLERIPNTNTAWKCQCRCGHIGIVKSQALRSGLSQSCGCLHRELLRTRLTKHGAAATPEYKIFHEMWARCTNPKRRRYHRYGGRGITICARWQTFEHFLADMGPRPSPAHSLDRFPNPDGHYEPGNVRWATPLEQAQSLSTTRRITWEGRTLTLTQWSQLTGISRGALRARLQADWPLETVFTTPNQH